MDHRTDRQPDRRDGRCRGAEGHGRCCRSRAGAAAGRRAAGRRPGRPGAPGDNAASKPVRAVLTFAGSMGEDAARVAGLVPVLLPLRRRQRRRHAAAGRPALRTAGWQLSGFAGGDGTARDIQPRSAGPPCRSWDPGGGQAALGRVRADPGPRRCGMAAWQGRTRAPSRCGGRASTSTRPHCRPTGPSSHSTARPWSRAPRSYVPAAKAAPQPADEAALDGLARSSPPRLQPGRLYL